jgi:RND family efflux transporter MFP subunit
MKRLIAIACAAACSKSEAPTDRKGQKLEYPVDVAKLEVRQMQYTVTAPGSIDAFQQVQITSRVSGAVDKVAFVEGQNVKAGDVLATIESERYAIAVAQAKSVVLKSETTQKAAEAALERRLTASKDSPGLVPGEEIEQKRAAVDTAKADVEASKQAQRVAELNLRDSMVRAPIAGVVQTRTVQQGQYLQPGAVLATILQRDPMLLRFQVSEQDAPRLKNDMQAILVLKESPRQFTAKITLVGGSADPTTRMVPVTAQIDTTDHTYWLRPGAFCEVTVPIGDARKGIVVPSLAVQPTEKGSVVFVIDDKNIAHARVVTLGMHTPEGGVELTRGVKEGEIIAVRGIEPLNDGAPVKVGSHLTLEQAEAPLDAGAGPATPPVSPVGGSGDGSAHEGSGSAHHKKDAP